MNKVLIFVLLALVSCHHFDFEAKAFKKFQQFMKKYQKKYTSYQEFVARFNVFKHNLLKVKKVANDVRHKVGITKFFDLTEQEFRKTYLNLDVDALALMHWEKVTVTPKNDEPEEFDWRDKGYVNPVKDQASCGSCWAFSAIANVEGQYFKKTNTLKRFSEQLLVDCDTFDSGCRGGLQERTFRWMIQNHGVELEEDYPYTARGGICKMDQSKLVQDAKVKSFKKLGNCISTWCPVDEKEIKTFLLETGPLAIALNANSLHSYRGGVIDDSKTKCSPSGMNHAVTLIGYGHDEETDLDYWLVRNSWGNDWGEEGLFKMSRGKCTCGICQYIITAYLE